MKERISVWTLSAFLMLSCANQATLTGGEKDSTPPEVVGSTPERDATEFHGRKVEITFDEFIQLRNTSEILISPYVEEAIKYSASGKKLSIDFGGDVRLADSMTYEISFGNSLVDLNEGNAAEGFTYRFSTYNELDSLKLVGTVVDGFTQTPVKDALVAFYQLEKGGSQQIDSLKPIYVQKTLENGEFDIGSLKAGKYWVRAFIDDNRDYVIQPNERFGFMEQPVFIDSIVDTVKIRITADRDLSINYSIDFKSFTNPIIVSSKAVKKGVYFTDSSGQAISGVFGLGRDTFYLHDSLGSQIESILVNGSSNDIDTIRILKRSKKEDATSEIRLSILSKRNYSNVFILGRRGVTDSFDVKKLHLIAGDSTNVTIQDGSIRYDGTVKVVFTRNMEENSLKLTVDSGAIWAKGISNKKTELLVPLHDSSQTGSIEFLVDSSQYNSNETLICSLLDKDGNTLRQQATNTQTFEFKKLTPGSYKLRVIVDENNNGIWDSNRLSSLESQEEILEFGPYNLQEGWDLMGNVIKLTQ